MKRIIFALAILLSAISVSAQMDIPVDGGNVKAFTSEDVGITSISVKYWRPKVKGREGKIWGTLVPYGFSTYSFVTGQNTSPWRAGANDATIISFEHDVKIEGKDMKAGSYALYMAMGADSITLIFSKENEAWGSFYYRQEDDVLRVKVKPVSLDKSIEWLKYEFIEHSEKSCVLALQWEKLSVPFKIDVDVDNIIIARLRKQVTGVKSFISGDLLQASRYCFSKNINMEEALSWARRAVTGQPMSQSGFDAYWNLSVGYEKMGRQPQADSVMNAGLPIASLSQTTGYGRGLIMQKRADRALEILTGTQAKFGDVYAVNNALSYAYSAKGNFAKATEYATKALAQASARQKINVNANIEKLKLGKDINQ